MCFELVKIMFSLSMPYLFINILGKITQCKKNKFIKDFSTQIFAQK